MSVQDHSFTAKLCDFIKNHVRKCVPATQLPPQDLESQYKEILNSKGWDDRQIFIYLRKLQLAHDFFPVFCEGNEDYLAMQGLMVYLDKLLSPVDKRDSSKVIYRAEVVLAVILIAKLCGCENCYQYAKFWFEENPMLQYLVPGMPEPKYMISDDTCKNILSLLPKDSYEDILVGKFNRVKVLLNHLSKYMDENNDSTLEDDDNGPYKPTIGGDGQEITSSYRKGETSRKKKGAIAVSLYDCDNRVAIAATTEQKKNNELNAFMRMFNKILVDGENDMVFYADAVNTRHELIDYLNKSKVSWIFPIKRNGANRKFNDEIAKVFTQYDNSELNDVTFFTQSNVSKANSRLETREFTLLPIDTFSRLYKGTKSVLRVVKTSQRIIAGKTEKKNPTVTVSYYISSLSFGEENFHQIVHSIRVRWRYEQHHNTLDVTMHQDYQAVRDENHLAAIVGLNKCAYNVLTFARAYYTEHGRDMVKHRNAKTKANARPISYKATIDTFRYSPLLAVDILIKYLQTKAIN